MPNLPLPFPPLTNLPSSATKRLIDVGVLANTGSSPGQNERYRRGETPHTLHVWWARRPHRSMRALVFSSLCSDVTPSSTRTLEELSGPALPDEASLERARELIQKANRSRPKLLDMFGGGGTIAFEASLFGAEAHSIDSNELAVFLQRTLLRRPALLHAELCEIVQRSGQRILESLTKTTAPLFPLRQNSFGYLWTYSMACRECGFRFYLSKRPWLSRKNGKRIALHLGERESSQHVSIRHSALEDDFVSAWQGRNGTVDCPKCNARHTNISLAATTDEHVAVIRHAVRSGKEFATSYRGALPSRELIRGIEETTLQNLEASLPNSKLPKWSGVVNPAIYGMTTHADFLNPRQRAVLLLLIQELRNEYHRLCGEISEDAAKSVIAYLSGLIDQLVDWNCRLSMWISQNEQVGRAFSGPGVAMLWDYVETDPVHRGPANLWTKLERIVAGLTSLSSMAQDVQVGKGYAQSLPYPDGHFDAIVTDPPYYDNVYYNALADFFYSWKRILFRSIEPELFAASETDSSRELVASKFRHGDGASAHDQYCQQLGFAIQEAERVLKPEGVFSLVYSHGAIRGWQALVQAYRRTNLLVTSVQPLNIERKARPRAMNSNAVNTCVVFVARRTHSPRCAASSDEFNARFRELAKDVFRCLGAQEWSALDVAIAAYAQGVGLLMNVSEITDGVDDMGMLMTFETIVREEIPDFRVSNRKSL